MIFKRKALLLFTLLALSVTPLLAQEAEKDSLVRLLSAKSAELIKKDGISFRKVIGPAHFLHNNTDLICDSALWNVDAKYIDCMGHVQLAQKGTLLTSDQLHYVIDNNTAQFRGGLVELKDKKNNTMRTRYLDYNTKDSLGLFYSGGAMRDEDGNLIESLQGQYDGKMQTFTFERDVEFFSDTLFLKTSKLVYETNTEKARFDKATNLWRGEYFLSADDGWYNRKSGDVFFDKNVYANDRDYEMWSDSLFFSRDSVSQYAELNRNVMVLDTASSAAFFGNKFTYQNDTIRKNHSKLSDQAAIIYFGLNEANVPDSAFMCADTMFLYTRRRCDISDSEVKKWDGLRDLMMQDPIGDMRKEKAEAYAKQQAEEFDKNKQFIDRGPGGYAKKDSTANAKSGAKPGSAPNAGPGAPGQLPSAGGQAIKGPGGPPQSQPADSASKTVLPAADSTFAIVKDSSGLVTASSLAAIMAKKAAAQAPKTVVDTSKKVEPKDTTMIAYLMAQSRIKAYRNDIQLVCDSLFACSLDSLATVYKNPALWEDTTNQLTSDSMRLFIRNRQLTKGNMMSNAFIITKNDSTHYNQIKGTEMIGHFRENHLYRYDALGGASAVFYLAEHGELTTVNVKSAKMLSADIKENRAQKTYYFDAVQSDAYPLLQVDSNTQYLKDFNWRGNERPVNRYAVTKFNVPKSERKKWSNLQKPRFPYADQYFRGYMPQIFKEIDARAEANRIAALVAGRKRDSLAIYAGLDAEGRMIVDDSIVGAHLLKADYLAISDAISETSKSMVAEEIKIRPLYDRIRLEDMRAEQHLDETMKSVTDSIVNADVLYEKVADSLEVIRAAKQAKIDSLFKVRKDSIMQARKNQPDTANAAVNEKPAPAKQHISFFQRIRNFFHNLFHRKPKAPKATPPKAVSDSINAASAAVKEKIESAAGAVKAEIDSVKVTPPNY